MLAEATPKETVCNNSMSTTIGTQKTRLGEISIKDYTRTQYQIEKRLNSSLV
jgi:hypothetical protein